MPGHYDPATIRSQLVRSDGRLPDPHFRTRLPSVSSLEATQGRGRVSGTHRNENEFQLPHDPRRDRPIASVGSVEDAYDNALAELLIDSFKTELIADRI